MTNKWQIEDITVGADNLLWLTVKNAPEVLLVPGTLHLRTFHEIDSALSVEENVSNAVLELKRRAFFLEEKQRERQK